MMSAPQPAGGRESEASSTDAGAGGVEWIEPVFGTDPSRREELARGEALAIPTETAALSPALRSARPRRGRRLPASQVWAPGRAAPAKWQVRHSATPGTESAIAAAHMSRLSEAISAEREAAASAFAVLHGTLGPGALAALYETLAAERELAIARIVRLGAERAAASMAIATASGTAVARTGRVQDADAASIWTAISPLWRRDDSSRRDATGSAVILARGGPDYGHRTGTEISGWRGPEAKGRANSHRRLVVNAFALLVAMVGVVAYYSSDIWPARARQTPSAAAAAALPSEPAASDRMPADPAQRFAYFHRQAEAGDAAAQYALGVLYAQGDGVAQDYASAATWFRKAAAGGIVNAEDLAALYQRGIASPQDFVVAAYWYRNAAERGVEAAMPMLARLYERGQGVAASPIDAYAWYRAAARRGDAIAGERAAALFTNFDGAEKGRAVMRAAEIVKALHEPREAASGSATLLPGDWIGRSANRDHASN